MDANKRQQAVQIIASKIAALPANTPMDYGTIGATLKMTKREGEAHNMAQYFVSKIERVPFTGALWENMSDAERTAIEAAKEIAAEVIAITGK